MDFFSLWWIPFIVAGGLGIGAWSMWLEHKRKEKALDVLKERDRQRARRARAAASRP